jgi:hypothetical protein
MKLERRLTYVSDLDRAMVGANYCLAIDIISTRMPDDHSPDAFDDESQYEEEAPPSPPRKKPYRMTEAQRQAWLRCTEARIKRQAEMRAERERVVAQRAEEKAEKRKLARDIRLKYSIEELKELQKPPVKQVRDKPHTKRPPPDETEEDDVEEEVDAPQLRFEIDYDEIAKHVAARLAKTVKVAPPKPKLVRAPPPTPQRAATPPPPQRPPVHPGSPVVRHPTIPQLSFV